MTDTTRKIDEADLAMIVATGTFGTHEAETVDEMVDMLANLGETNETVGITIFTTTEVQAIAINDEVDLRKFFTTRDAA